MSLPLDDPGMTDSTDTSGRRMVRAGFEAKPMPESALWESALPLDEGHMRKQRELNPQGLSLGCFQKTAAIAHWLALPFKLRRQESNLQSSP